MFIFFSIFQFDFNFTTDIIIGSIDGKFYLVTIWSTYFEILLIGFFIQNYVHIYGAFQST